MRLVEIEIPAIDAGFLRGVLEVLFRPRCEQTRLGTLFDYLKMPRILVWPAAGQRLNIFENLGITQCILILWLPENARRTAKTSTMGTPCGCM